MSSIIHSFGEQKYTVMYIEYSGKFEALRHGEPWRDLTGDGMILAMLQDYDFLTEQSQIADMQVDSLLHEVDFLKDQITRLEHKIETLETEK